ncbi:MAG: LysM peptidoglycan-binding domain-containing protein [Candidatus Methanosuratincola sp.]|jgi:peptidoglycan endopeptidase LytF
MLERIVIPLYLFLIIPISAGATNIYVVQKGDNLYDIAKRFGTTVELIKKANNLSTDKLDIGDSLLIPQREDSPKGKDPFYTVQSGDTLGGVARKYGVSVVELKKLNNLDGDAISVGQRLKITAEASPVESPGSAEGEKAHGGDVYRVKGGDTLGSIAKKYGTTVSFLKQLNGLSSDRLSIGQKLLIPGAPTKAVADERVAGTASTVDGDGVGGVGISYVVKVGDTLGEIAKAHGVSVEAIRAANGLNSNFIKAGKAITIPSKGSQTVTVARTSKGGGEDASYPFIQHRVRKGDTLSQISRRYRVSIAAIKAANGLRSHRIKAGDVLKVPSRGAVVARARSSEDGARVRSGRSEGSLIVEKLLSSGVIGDSVVSFAKSFIGAPYKFGGTSLVSGIDCSAFVSKVYDYFHVKLPRTARQMFSVGYDVNKSELQSADLVFFTTYAKYPSHVGIYTGDEKFIHASSRAKQVTIGDMRQRYYAKRYIGARRVISVDDGYKN